MKKIIALYGLTHLQWEAGIDYENVKAKTVRVIAPLLGEDVFLESASHWVQKIADTKMFRTGLIFISGEEKKKYTNRYKG